MDEMSWGRDWMGIIGDVGMIFGTRATEEYCDTGTTLSNVRGWGVFTNVNEVGSGFSTEINFVVIMMIVFKMVSTTSISKRSKSISVKLVILKRKQRYLK